MSAPEGGPEVVPAVGRTDEMEKLKRRSECCARLCPDQNSIVQLVTDDLLTLGKGRGFTQPV